jgi:hypothetical protein
MTRSAPCIFALLAACQTSEETAPGNAASGSGNGFELALIAPPAPVAGHAAKNDRTAATEASQVVGCAGDSCNLPHMTSTCVDGSCVLGACAPGFADCDGNAANGCEISYCGDCSDPCACEPAAMQLDVSCFPAHLAVDSSSVYWAQAWQIASVAKNCPAAPSVIVSNPPYAIRDLAVDGIHAYFLQTPGELARIAIGGGPIQPLAGGLEECWSLASDETTLYLGCDNALIAIPKHGGASNILVSNVSHVTNLLVDGEDIYFSTHSSMNGSPTGYVARIWKTGGAPSILAEGTNAFDLAVDDGNVYWGAPNNQNGANIWKVAKDGPSAPVALAFDWPFPESNVIHGNRVYWAHCSPSGHIDRVATDGGPVEVLYPGNVVSLMHPRKLRLDGDLLFMITSSGPGQACEATVRSIVLPAD